MADPRLFRLRVTFAKQGRLVMLSHLELCRALERSVRRAQLPYAVSQGFSPHMRIAFGAALPVGVGGRREVFDIFLERYLAPDKALAALKASCVPDLMVETCVYVEHRAPAASVAFPLSVYRAVFSNNLDELVVPERITVVRKKKEKELEVANFLHGNISLESIDEGGVVLSCAEFSLEAKETGSLRPDAFIRACMEATVAAGKASAKLNLRSLTRIEQRTLDEM